VTSADLFKKIDELVEAYIVSMEKAERAIYMANRTAILEATRKVWDAAAVAPAKSAEVGNVVYVSRAKAFQYGRIDKLNDLISEEAKKAAIADISNIEVNGVNIYATQYDGYAWAYSQGYALPITGGAKVKLVADALYSDFSGMAFDERVKKNLGVYADDILGTVTRGLNQGYSYQKIAKELAQSVDRQYKSALTVARTEGGRIQSRAYLDSLALLDEVGAEYGKMWDATIDDKTRAMHQQMDGVMADKDGIFHLPDGATCPAPHYTGVAKHDINERCVAVTIINGQKPTERRIRGEGIVPYETYTERLERGGEIPMRDVKNARA
jgi:hypothetical protein